MGKVYKLCRVKTGILAVLTVKSGLDPHMINELEDVLNCGPYLWLWLCFCYTCSVSFNVGFGMNLYLRNQVLKKFDQLKIAYRSKPLRLSLLLAFMSYNSQHLLSTNHKCTHAYYSCCSEEKVDVKSFEDDAEF
jgi:hypothetical protein